MSIAKNISIGSAVGSVAALFALATAHTVRIDNKTVTTNQPVPHQTQFNPNQPYCGGVTVSSVGTVTAASTFGSVAVNNSSLGSTTINNDELNESSNFPTPVIVCGRNYKDFQKQASQIDFSSYKPKQLKDNAEAVQETGVVAVVGWPSNNRITSTFSSSLNYTRDDSLKGSISSISAFGTASPDHPEPQKRGSQLHNAL
jgi:hypothetical protein